MNVIVEGVGEIVINEGEDVKQNKGPILVLYNTIRKVSSDYLYCVSVRGTIVCTCNYYYYN